MSYLNWVCGSDLGVSLDLRRGLNVYWLMVAFVHTEVTLCGWQEVLVQLCTHFCRASFSSPWLGLAVAALMTKDASSLTSYCVSSSLWVDSTFHASGCLPLCSYPFPVPPASPFPEKPSYGIKYWCTHLSVMTWCVHCMCLVCLILHQFHCKVLDMCTRRMYLMYAILAGDTKWCMFLSASAHELIRHLDLGMTFHHRCLWVLAIYVQKWLTVWKKQKQFK